NPYDLMLLDLKLAGMSGLTLMQKVRDAASPIEVIVVSANSQAATVRALVHRGVIDYLIKPFPVERLRDSLGHFLHRAAAMRGRVLDQHEADRACACGRVSRRWLPKGVT